MAHERTFRIAKLSDKQFSQLIDAIAKEFVDFSGEANFSEHLKSPLPETEKTNNFRPKVFAIHRFTGRSSNHSFSLSFARGISGSDWGHRTPSGYQDEIRISTVINNNANKPKIEDFLKLTEIIHKHTTTIDTSKVSHDPNLAVNLLTAEIQKLAELQTGLVEGADAKRRELDSLKSELDKNYDDRVADLKESFEKRQQELDQEKLALEKLRKELDDREHKHVRRELRTSISAEIDEEISTGSNLFSSLRSDFYGIYLAITAAVVLGYFTYLTQSSLSETAIEIVRDENGIITQKPSSEPTVWLLYFKLFISAGATFGLMFYVISWLRNLSQDVRQYRRQLLRNRFDINRASWTIETILEMSEKEQLEVQNVWLERVTENMFVENGQVKGEPSSLDALAALLNVTTEAEIGPDGPKFRMNRKGTKAAAASLNS